MCWCRTTDRIAVPIEPPTRCSVVSWGVAWLTWSLRRTAKAAVIAGIIDMPMPKPRTIIAAGDHEVGRVGVDQDEGDGRDDGDDAADEGGDAAAPAVGRAAGEEHRDAGADALRGEQQARGDGVLAANGLVVERHQDHRAEERGAEAEGRDRRGREALVLVEADVEQRVADVQGADHEGGDQCEADAERDQHAAAGEGAGAAALGQAVGDAHDAGRDEPEAERVELAGASSG